MKEIIKKIGTGVGVASLFALSVLGATSTVTTPTAQAAVKDQICSGADKALGGNSGVCSGQQFTPDSVWGLAGTIINWILIVVGIIAVLFIIIGGIRYATSAGDPDKVKKAKNTILYAMIGLAVALLAAVIVNLVVNITGEVAP